MHMNYEVIIIIKLFNIYKILYIYFRVIKSI